MMLFSSSNKNYDVKRFYYNQNGNNKKLEQSLDVYTPRHKNDNDDNIVIVLVMGSGWLGHSALVYTPTNWWNSGGPRTICTELGITCVSIRHSGGFFRFWPSVLILTLIAFIILLTTKLILLQQEKDLSNNFFVGVVLICSGLILKVSEGKEGGATLDEMMEDVAQALEFVRCNDNDDVIPSKSKLIIGGYSSGVHVLATLLHQRPEIALLNQKKKDIIGILYLSGLLRIQESSSILLPITWALFSKLPDDLPQPYRSGTPPKHVPHFLIGCQNETFGLPLLDRAFAIKPYYEWLQSINVPIKYTLLPAANHWNILTHKAMVDAIQHQFLPWIMEIAAAASSSANSKNKQT